MSQKQPTSTHLLRSVYVCQEINHFQNIQFDRYIYGKESTIPSLNLCQGINQVQRIYFVRCIGVKESTKFNASTSISMVVSGNQSILNHILRKGNLRQRIDRVQNICFDRYVCVRESSKLKTSTSIMIFVSRDKPISKHPPRSVHMRQGIFDRYMCSKHPLRSAYVLKIQPLSKDLLRWLYLCQGLKQMEHIYCNRQRCAKESTKSKHLVGSLFLDQGNNQLQIQDVYQIQNTYFDLCMSVEEASDFKTLTSNGIFVSGNRPCSTHILRS